MPKNEFPGFLVLLNSKKTTQIVSTMLDVAIKPHHVLVLVMVGGC